LPGTGPPIGPISSMSTEVPTQAQQPAPGSDGHWHGRHVLLAVTGGIACYKAASLTSLLVQQGAQVRVAMTEAATQFVGPLTFQSLSGQPTITTIWQSQDHHESQHVGIARWCDLMIIAPASADIIAKLTAGICDDVVSLTACALPKSTPVLLAPSMNADMWANPIVQRNLTTVKETLSYQTVGPGEGWQACRTEGAGRMSEPVSILEAAEHLLIDERG
jgi:phosphopantothenoylcysteine synthetase/decarboxylase